MKTFTITENHLKLIKKMCVNKTSCDTPQVDMIRPYGNSAVFDDIAHILGLPQFDNRIADYLEGQYDLMKKYHTECSTALQICMSLLKFETGVYMQIDDYDSRAWIKIED